MAVTLAQLAAALRLDDGVAEPEEPVRGILTRLNAAAEALVEKQAPSAPADIKAEAVIRLSSFLFDAPPAAQGDRFAFAWRSSGAAGLVAPWTSKRAGDATATAEESA